MAVILQESLRALFYAPFYAALARDAFTAEGVEIRFVSSPRPQDAALRLMDGTVDVCWGGPMRVMETYQKVPGCDIVCFAEVVTRDPFLLMGRAPRPDFTLADLKSARLATVSEVPTPWLCLQHDLRLAGIDPSGIARVADQTMPDNVAALKAGEVDVIQVFEPFPSLLLAEGAGFIIDSHQFGFFSIAASKASVRFDQLCCSMP
jgi:NitT/TauT family transport system substrate-binding protein